MFNATLEKQLEKVAPKITAAEPSKAKSIAKATWLTFKMFFFPILPGLVKVAVEQSKTTKDEKTLREIRDVLIAADLGISE